jgi:hypothetical protein
MACAGSDITFCTVAIDAMAGSSGNGATAIAGVDKLWGVGTKFASTVNASLVVLDIWGMMFISGDGVSDVDIDVEMVTFNDRAVRASRKAATLA